MTIFNDISNVKIIQSLHASFEQQHIVPFLFQQHSCSTNSCDKLILIKYFSNLMNGLGLVTVCKHASDLLTYQVISQYPRQLYIKKWMQWVNSLNLNDA